jgi:hypothetical protein
MEGTEQSPNKSNLKNTSKNLKWSKRLEKTLATLPLLFVVGAAVGGVGAIHSHLIKPPESPESSEVEAYKYVQFYTDGTFGIMHEKGGKTLTGEIEYNKEVNTASIKLQSNLERDHSDGIKNLILSLLEVDGWKHVDVTNKDGEIIWASYSILPTPPSERPPGSDD